MLRSVIALPSCKRGKVERWCIITNLSQSKTVSKCKRLMVSLLLTWSVFQKHDRQTKRAGYIEISPDSMWSPSPTTLTMMIEEMRTIFTFPTLSDPMNSFTITKSLGALKILRKVPRWRLNLHNFGTHWKNVAKLICLYNCLQNLKFLVRVVQGLCPFTFPTFCKICSLGPIPNPCTNEGEILHG